MRNLIKTTNWLTREAFGGKNSETSQAHAMPESPGTPVAPWEFPGPALKRKPSPCR